MPHNVSVVYRKGCNSRSEINQSHSVVHLGIGKHGFGGGIRREVLARYADAYIVECQVYGPSVGRSSDKQLEVALYLVSCHTFKFLFYDLEFFAVGEGLRDRSEKYFRFRIGKRIGVYGHLLEVVDLLF